MDGQNFQTEQNEQTNASVNNYQDNTAQAVNQVPPVVGTPQKQNNTLAIVSLVMGILAIVLACCASWIGIVPGIAGIICAVLANKQGKSGMATAGLICSIIGIVIALLLTVVYVIFGAALMSELGGYGYY